MFRIEVCQTSKPKKKVKLQTRKNFDYLYLHKRLVLLLPKGLSGLPENIYYM